MIDFDVIVIGGGPAGCYAALAAALKGSSVAIFEEHVEIGRPRHDPGWLMESQFSKSLINVLGKNFPWTKVKEFRVYNSESGDLIENSALGGYLVLRDLLEKEVAAMAVKAGACLYLNTKVTRFIRKAGKVEGIETNSKVIPNAKGKIFICADGIRSAYNGFSLKEGLCARGPIRAGQSYLLSNAEVSAGVIEMFRSANPLLNKTFWSHRDGMCFMSFSSPAAFYALRERDDNIISRKIKNAYPVEISGYSRASSEKYAVHFKNLVKDNILFVGDASGGAGTIHGMLQGCLAGTISASAIKENKVCQERLLEYQQSVSDTLGKAPFFWRSAIKEFGSYNNWFLKFEAATKGIEAMPQDSVHMK